MKYIILLYGPETEESYENLSPKDFEAAMQKHSDFTDWCMEHDISIDSSLALVQSIEEFIVHTDGGETDGPYLELKEQLGGYYVIETDSVELAREAARRCPNYGSNVLRPAASRP